MTHRYHINVFYRPADGAYVADVPDLRYCSAVGDTPEDAVREVQVANNAWVATAEAAGKVIPEATYRPAPST